MLILYFFILQIVFMLLMFGLCLNQKTGVVYLKTDVQLLADVLERFIITYLGYYELGLFHYFRSPRQSWDAMPEVTKIELELLKDIDIHVFTY